MDERAEAHRALDPAVPQSFPFRDARPSPHVLGTRPAAFVYSFGRRPRKALQIATTSRPALSSSTYK
jgi:hypothetical protein